LFFGRKLDFVCHWGEGDVHKVVEGEVLVFLVGWKVFGVDYLLFGDYVFF